MCNKLLLVLHTTILLLGSILYFANTSALTYVDLDDDNDSFEVAVDTPLTSARHKMPQVEVAKPAQTEVDLAAAKQEEPQPPAGKLTEYLMD